MWLPFKKKQTLITPPDLPLAVQLKSISLPNAAPSWKLHAQSRTNWSDDLAVAEGYQASAIVYACVEKRATLVASVPWKAYRVDADGEGEAMPNSALQRLIDRPNNSMSFYELIYQASQSLDLSGQAFISKIKAGVAGLPVEMWYLPPSGMKIKPGRTQVIEGFEYKKQSVDAADMIMLRRPNPASPYFGMPVLMAAGRATDIDREGGIWQKVSLENRGAADVNIKLPDNATQEQADNVKAQYQKQQAGPKNARKALITNAEVQQLGQNAVELDFVASRRAVWTEIAAVFGMSLSNLGMTEDVNLANAEAMDRALWLNTIIPILILIQHQINHQLAADFGPEWELRPDLSNVQALQENAAEKLDNAGKLFNMGVPFDMINQKLELGFDEFEGSAVGYVPSSLIPAAYNTNPPDDVDEGTGTDDENDDEAGDNGANANGE